MTDYFIADTHFNHKNIIKYSYDYRPFDSIEVHNEVLIRNWNKVVTSKDRIYVLGDFAFGDKSKIPELLDRLNGYKILVYGNHDLFYNEQQWLSAGFDKVLPMAVYKGCLLTHIPVDCNEMKPVGRFIANIHGHLHEKGNSQRNILSHKFCVSAEQINLKPISWEQLWERVLNLSNRYNKISDSTHVMPILERSSELRQFDKFNKRINEFNVPIDKTECYEIVNYNKDLGLVNLIVKGKLYWLRSKSFIGVGDD